MEEYTESRPLAQPPFNTLATDLSDLLGCTETHGDLLAGENSRVTAHKSGCDIPLQLSMFADVKARQIEPNHLSLRELQDRLTRSTAPDMAALPLV